MATAAPVKKFYFFNRSDATASPIVLQGLATAAPAKKLYFFNRSGAGRPSRCVHGCVRCNCIFLCTL
jgi:hypothetical protein